MSVCLSACLPAWRKHPVSFCPSASGPQPAAAPLMFVAPMMLQERLIHSAATQTADMDSLRLHPVRSCQPALVVHFRSPLAQPVCTVAFVVFTVNTDFVKKKCRGDV